MIGDPVRMTADLAELGRALAQIDAEETRIAQTPKDRVFRDGKAALYRYRAERTPRLGPLVLVHGLIGRQTMTDLEPNRSLVLKLLAAGVDTFVIDWGDASRADRFRSVADYADRMLARLVDAALAEAEAERCALLGICQGGTFALCHAALNPDRIAGVAVAIAPVDFHADARTGEPGMLNHWLRNLPAELIERFLEEHGNLPGRLTGAIFQNLTPARTLAKYTTELAKLADDPGALKTFLRMERWLSDRPDHPGAAAREWLVELYGENRLAAGRFALDGRPVRLTDIRAPVLNIYGAEDHIVPPACSAALRELLPADHDYQEVAVPSGHVGVFVSRRAIDIVPPAIIGWLARIG